MQVQKPKLGYKLVKWHFGKYEEIPIDWEDKKIDDMIKFEGGSQPPRVHFVFQPIEGYVRMIQIRDFKTNRFPTYILKKDARKFFTKDDIMIGRYGPPNFQILRGLEGAYNVALIKVIPQNMLEKDYLYYFLKQKKFFLLMDSLGQRTAGQDGVELDVLKKLSFPLPPKKERLKIISILSNVDNLIQSYDKVIASTKLLKRGFMQQFLTKGIGHTKFKKVKDFFKREFEIPALWDYPLFSSVVTVNPITKIHTKKAPYVPMDAVDLESPHVNYFEERDAKNYPSLPKFKENDVLFASITPSTENGKTALIEHFDGEGIASSELTVLRPSKKVIPRYLFYYVKSYRIRQFAISQMMGTTNRQRVPNYVFKKDLHFELPSVEEQHETVSILSNLDSVIYQMRKTSSNIQKLKKGLIQKLLTGQIRV